MKIVARLIFPVFLAFLCTGQVVAQSSQKSSGVIELHMSKTKKEPTRTEASNVSSTTFTPTIKKASDIRPEQPSVSIENKINWISPALNSMNTSNSSYTINANISAAEALKVVNVFINDEFYRNYIVGAEEAHKFSLSVPMDLGLGANIVKIQGVTENGDRIEDQVYINYDLSSAKYYALIIAVEDYNDPEISDLDEPVKDASKFYEIINRRYTFDEENITFLKNPSKADIIGTLHKMRGVLTEDDNLLIYYAGHGYWDEEMLTGYWLPSDAEKDNPVNWLPNTDLTNYLSVLKSKHTLLIADACFSGGIFKTRRAFTSRESIERLYRLPSRKAMTSGALNEVPDQSVFIEKLLYRLLFNRDKYLAAEQLFADIKIAVMNNTDNVPRYEPIKDVGDEGGEFIFILR